MANKKICSKCKKNPVHRTLYFLCLSCFCAASSYEEEYIISEDNISDNDFNIGDEEDRDVLKKIM